MLIKHINSYALNRLKFIVIVLAILGASVGALASYDFSNRGEEESFRSTTQSLQSEIQSIKRKITDSGSALELWNNEAKEKHVNRDGVQVDFAKTLINELKEKYKIQGLTISLSAPEKRVDMTFNQHIDIQYSTLKLTFVAPTDINAYLFIYDLQNSMPGYIQIKDISFIAINEITEEVLKGIERGEKNDIVSVKTEMIWQDFKDKVDTKKRTTNFEKLSPHDDMKFAYLKTHLESRF